MNVELPTDVEFELMVPTGARRKSASEVASLELVGVLEVARVLELPAVL
jgi:hypothetical protein